MLVDPEGVKEKHERCLRNTILLEGVDLQPNQFEDAGREEYAGRETFQIRERKPKGIKLDFKCIEAVEPTIKMLLHKNVSQQV